MSIELRLTEVDPPTAEPHRTIYHDIASLPDPVVHGMTVRYFNYDDVGLYMQITGVGTGYTFTPANLGLLATGANAYKNLDNFISRARPTAAQLPNGEMGENIVLTLKAYTDAGYTNLKWTFNRTVQVIWLNSGDAAFTTDFSDNFDDGTVDGWAATLEAYCFGGSSATCAVATDYVLSPSYSLKLTVWSQGQAFATCPVCRGNIHKTFATPNKSEVYAIIDIRNAKDSNCTLTFLKVANGSTVLIYILPQPANKWIRIVVPLPSNSSVPVTIITQFSEDTQSQGGAAYLWLDDFKIISK